LFQETEHVSADRLFRVRLKQSYVSAVKCHEQSDAVEKIDKVDALDASTVECHGQNDYNDATEELVKSAMECHGQNDYDDYEEPLEGDEVTEVKPNASIVSCNRWNYKSEKVSSIPSFVALMEDTSNSRTAVQKSTIGRKILRRDEMVLCMMLL